MTSSARTNYEEIPQLADLYLEDSYVLGVESTDGSVTFDLDLVLMADHPAYRDPPPTEPYCFRRGRIAIDGARSVRWIRRTMKPIRDATGEVDYGSIDAWYVDDGVTHVEGDWGEVEVDGGTVRVELENDDAGTSRQA